MRLCIEVIEGRARPPRRGRAGWRLRMRQPLHALPVDGCADRAHPPVHARGGRPVLRDHVPRTMSPDGKGATLLKTKPNQEI